MCSFPGMIPSEMSLREIFTHKVITRRDLTKDGGSLMTSQYKLRCLMAFAN
jgi:hypothetical protein